MNTAKKNTNIILLNFQNTMKNIVLEISNDKSIFFSKKISLYINMLRNESNIFLENKKLTNIIKQQILNKINMLYLINNNQINKSKKALGISEEEKFVNTSTAILLARNNHAAYYLDSSITKSDQKLLLNIQLILVKTGEIIFRRTREISIL